MRARLAYTTLVSSLRFLCGFAAFREPTFLQNQNSVSRKAAKPHRKRKEEIRRIPIMKSLPLILLAILPVTTAAQVTLVPQRVSLKDGRRVTFNLPAGFEIIPAAEGLKRVRFFAKAPDGRIFVTDMYNLTDNERGAVYILDGWDETAGKFSKVVPYMTGLRNPNSVQFYRDARGQDWFYLAETDKLT